MSIATERKLVLEILYQDKELCVVNKAPGFHTDEIEKLCAESRPNIKAIHRLDRETSGALILATPSAETSLAPLFRNAGGVEKIYWVGTSEPYEWIAEGHSSYNFNGFIGSRYRSSKRSHVSFEKSFRGFHSVREISHIVRRLPDSELAEFRNVFSGHPLELQLLTGARHQIRAYFEFKKAAIVGDPLYNPSTLAKRMELHCRSLKLVDPRTQKELIFVAPLRA